jgi:membrane-associated phospholipid phosphatase
MVDAAARTRVSYSVALLARMKYADEVRASENVASAQPARNARLDFASHGSIIPSVATTPISMQSSASIHPSRSILPRWAIPVFALLFVVALFLDIPIADWVHSTGLSAWLKGDPAHQWTLVVRFPGRFYFTILACVVLLIFSVRRHDPRPLDDAALVFLAGVLSGINVVLKWCVGRTRPFHDVGSIHNVPAFHLIPFRGGLDGLIHSEQNLSFPSGDASLAFAISAALVIVAPRWRAVWWIMGIIVGIERIAEGAHYPSDVVGGAILGILVAKLAQRILRLPPLVQANISQSV